VRAGGRDVRPSKTMRSRKKNNCAGGHGRRPETKVGGHFSSSSAETGRRERERERERDVARRRVAGAGPQCVPYRFSRYRADVWEVYLSMALVIPVKYRIRSGMYITNGKPSAGFAARRARFRARYRDAADTTPQSWHVKVSREISRDRRLIALVRSISSG